MAADASGQCNQDAKTADAPAGRLHWTPELTKRFDDAVRDLGGLTKATPAQIKEKMRTDLTLGHIKSRLQKLRLENHVVSSNKSLSTLVGKELTTHNSAAVDDMAVATSSKKNPKVSGSRRSFDDAFSSARNNRPPSRGEALEISKQLNVEMAAFQDFKW